MLQLAEFLKQFEVAKLGHDVGTKWHRTSIGSTNSYVGYDGKHYFFHIDADQEKWKWKKIASHLFMRSTEGPEGNIGILLRCEIEHRDRFAPFFHELMQKVEKGEGPVSAIANLLPKWFAFWNEPRPLLSKKEQIGLYGELCVLEKMIQIKENLIHTWISPHKKDDLHDFKGAMAHIEVKTSADFPRSMYISNIDQADSKKVPGGNLFFLIVELEEDEEGESLAKLVESQRNRFKNLSIYDDYCALISLSGITPNDMPYYNSEKYRIQNIYLLKINSDTGIYTSKDLVTDKSESVKKITQTIDYEKLEIEIYTDVNLRKICELMQLD